MRKFYLVSALIIAVLILILSVAQAGVITPWNAFFSTSGSTALVLLQIASLGAIMGGFLVLFWKMPAPKKGEPDMGDESESEEGGE